MNYSNLSFQLSPESVSFVKDVYHRLRKERSSKWEQLTANFAVKRENGRWYVCVNNEVFEVPHPAFGYEHRASLGGAVTVTEPKPKREWKAINGLNGHAWMCCHNGQWWYVIKGCKPEMAPSRGYIMAHIVFLVSSYFCDIANDKANEEGPEMPDADLNWSAIQGIGSKLAQAIQNLCDRKDMSGKEFLSNGQLFMDSKVTSNQKAQITKALRGAGYWK